MKKTSMGRSNWLKMFFWSFLFCHILAQVCPELLKAQQPNRKSAPPPARVEVSTILEKEVAEQVTLVGTAEPWLRTVIASEESGLVRKMLVDEGDSVFEGQILCEQETSQLKLNIEAAKAELAEAEVLSAQSKREWERQKRLFSNEIVSEKAYEDAQFEDEASQKRVMRLRAELYGLEDKLAKRRIKSPVSGIVLKRHALIGQWLDDGDPVVTLGVMNPIRVMVPVPEQYASEIKVGDLAQVRFDALPGRIFEGVIAALIPNADEATRTFPVRVELPNPGTLIMGGMLGRVTLPAGNEHQALLVPKDAIVLSGQGTFVYKINGNRAHPVPVKTGASLGSFVEVTGDLKSGLKVVVKGNERLMPGQSVQIIDSVTGR